jgi:hypothetical protein
MSSSGKECESSSVNTTNVTITERHSPASSYFSNCDFPLPLFDENSEVNPIFHLRQLATNGIQISSILDSGSEVNLLSGSNYEKLIKAGIKAPELPLENVVLVTAFGKRSQRIRRQALIEFTIGNDLFEGVFMITPQLNNEAIIGCNLLKEYGFNINFARESFSYIREGELREHLFSQRPGLQKVQSDDRSLAEDPFRKHPTPRVQRHFPKPADGQPEIPIPQQAETAGRLVREVKETGSLKFTGADSRDIEGRGDSTLGKGAESDLTYENRRVESNDVAALAISRSDGYFCKDATSQQNLVVNYVERDLPIRTHTPNSEPDTSECRSLRW